MKRAAPVLVVTALIALQFGCATTGPEPEPRPSWIRDPESITDSPRFIAAVGAASSQSRYAALEEARRKARSELSKVIAGYVSKSVKDFFSENPRLSPGREIGTRDFGSALAGKVRSDIMRRPIQEEVWVEKKLRLEASVLYRVPLVNVHNAIKDSVAAVSSNYGLFDPGSEKAALDELFNKLDRVIKKRTAEAARGETWEDRRLENVLSPVPPEWLATGKSERYPAARFLLSVGMGETASESEEDARRKSFHRIAALARIKADTFKERRDDIDPRLLDNLDALPSLRLRSTPEDVFHERIVERWYDPIINVHYTLALVERDLAVSECASAAARRAEDWKHLRRSGLNQKKAGNFRQALSELLDAAACGESALQLYLAAAAIKPSENKLDELSGAMKGASLKDTYADIDRLLKEFEIIPREGPAQWTAPGSEKPVVLSVQVLAGPDRAPVRGIPVKFEFADLTGLFEKNGESSIVEKTDREGVASALVGRTQDISRIDGKNIRAEIFVTEMLKEKVVLGAPEMPYIDFAYDTGQAPDPIVKLRIIETGHDGTVPEQSVIQSYIKQHLEKSGFSILIAEELDIPADVLSEDEDVKPHGKLLDAIDNYHEEEGALFIIGAAGSKITDIRQTSAGEIRFAVCRALVGLIRVGETPEILAFFETEGLAASIETKEKALAEAENNSAAKMAEKLIPYLHRHVISSDL